jgi:hypothetical protein
MLAVRAGRGGRGRSVSHNATPSCNTITCRKKLAEVNKKLGDKFEISDAELASTLEACRSLLSSGQTLDLGDSATQARADTDETDTDGY